MENNLHITLTGNLGSGKSTLTKYFTEKYGFEVFSTGKAIREIAEQHGISVLEMNELMTKDHSYDLEIDSASAKVSREKADKKLFIDSRLAWNFVDRAFKVFLSVQIDEAAARVYRDSSRGDVEKYKSVEDAKAQLIERAANEDSRYHEIYNIEYFNLTNYNLVLDSTDCDTATLSELLYREYEDYKAFEANGNARRTRMIVKQGREKEDLAEYAAKGTVSELELNGFKFVVIEL